MIDVLLVEDDDAHARLIQRAFDSSQVPANLRRVTDLGAMRAAINYRRPSLLILDYLLPDGRGADLLGDSALPSDLPTVMISSYVDAQVLSEAAHQGVRRLIPKSLRGLKNLPRLACEVLCSEHAVPASVQ